MQVSKRQMLTNLFVKRISLTIVLFALIFSLTTVYTYTRAGGPTRAYAATSSHLNFQARLLNSTGNTVADGFYNVEFNLYTVSTGGTSEWTETRIGGDKVRVANGYLSVALGDVTAFPGGVNWDQDHWLTMNIGGTGSPAWDGEMTPRLKLTAVPYAFQAKQAEKLTKLDGANTGVLDFLALTANRAINLPDQDGTLCIQGSADCVDVVTTNDTASTSSNSGLEISSDGLRLLGGCTDAQLLTWDETAKVWKCTTSGAAAPGFGTINAPSGTDPVGDGPNDTLNLTVSGSNFTITGDATTDILSFDILESALAGNGLVANGDSLDVNTGAGLEIVSDAVRIDQNYSFAWTADHTWNLSETEDLAVNLSLTGTTSGQAQVATVTNATSSGNQYGLYVDNAASSGTTEALLVLDNSDTDTAVSSAIQVVNAGGGFTNLFNIEGTLISVSEFTVLDGGITEGEVSGVITDVTAGGGLAGGGAAGNVTLDIGAGNGISVAADAISVIYGSSANTAVQGDQTLVCASGSGNLTGGGNTITLGAGGTCGAISTNNAVTFSTSVTTPLVTNAGQLDFSSTATAGADDIVFTNAGSESLRILENGDFKFERGTNDAFFTVAAPAGAPATYTFSGATGTVLTTANFAASLDAGYVNVGESPAAGDVSGSFSGGLLVNSVQNNSVDLGTDTVGDFVATITAGGGLTGTATGEGSTPTLAIGAGNGITVNADDIAVIYGSGTNTAVQGNQTLVCPTGTGDLTGGGNTITLGAGGTCGAITISEAPVFTTSVTTPLLTNAGALTLETTATGGADDLIFKTAGTEAMRLLEGGNLFFERGTDDATIVVATPSGAPATYTFSGATGTVLTSANFAASLDAGYVNINESPAAGDISGSYQSGFSVNSVQNNSVDLGTDTVGNFVATITAGGGLTGSATGEGTTPTLAIGAGNGITVNADDIAVTYGSAANTAVQGSTTLVCPSGSGDLTGGGNTITLGVGGTCSNITISEAPVFDTSVTTPLLTYAGALTLQTTATGGADDLIFKTAGNEVMRLLENGNLFFERGTDDATIVVATPSGAPATYTFSGATGTVLTSANFSGSLDGIYVNEGQSPAAGDVSGSFSGGLLVNSVQNNSVDLTTDTVGNYVASITAGGGLTGTAASEGSTPTLAIGAGNGITVNADDIAVIYGSGANTAVQGSVTIVCPSGTGDLVGTGNTITLGSGGTCNSITISEAPVFDTSVTTPLLTAAGALTIQTTATGGADDIIFQTAGTEKLRLLENGQLVFGTGANSANLYLSANDTLRTDDNLIVGGATNGLFMGDVGWAGLNAYGVAHTSLVAQTTYALLQINTGATFLNAASGQSVYIRIGNSSTNQAVFSATGLTLNGTTSNLVVAGTGNSTFAGNVDIAGTLAVGTTDAVTIAANGLITTADDLMVNGGNIGSSGALAVASGGSGALTLTSASGTVVLGSSTMQHSAAGFTFDLANAGASTFSISNSNGSNVANLDVEAAITAGNGNAFQVNIDGDITASMQVLNGSSTTNGTSGLGTSTSLTLNDASNFDVGNYVQVSDANCGGTGINPCYAKITAKATNTLTITPALRWTNAKTVTEYHVPELGGTNLTSTLANRYGRGYFIAGVATGNGTTYYNEDEIWTSLDTFNLLNTNVATLNIGGAATTLNIGNAATTVSILGSLQTAASETITAGGGLIVSSGGAVITGGIDNNSGGLSEVGALTGVSGITFTSGGLDLASGGITNAGSVAGVSTLGLSGAITGATSTNTINGLIINSGSLSGITGYSQTSGTLAFSGGGNLSIDSAAFDVTTGGAVSGVTTLGLSGAITGATSTNTINGLVINGGALSSVTGITLSSGNITSAAALSITSAAGTALTLDSGTTGTISLGAGSNAKTINIGTGTGGDTINIGMDNTTADTISIGSSTDTVTLTGSNSSTIVWNGFTLTATELNRLDGKDAALVDQNDFISGDGAGATSNGSGLEAGTNGIGLLQGCSNNQILKWVDASSVWNCAADATGISDIRAKKNVETVEGMMLDKIKDIRIVEFDYDCESPAFAYQHCDIDHQTGVIAQELAQIFPELVVQDEHGYYSVRYDALAIYNLKAVGELARSIKSNGDASLNNVTAQSLTVNGVLEAGTIRADHIEGLDYLGRIDELEANIETLSGRLAAVEQNQSQNINLSDLAVGKLAASGDTSLQGLTVNLDLVAKGAMIIEGQATFKEAVRFEKNVLLDGEINVLGYANMQGLTVNLDLIVRGAMIIDGKATFKEAVRFEKDVVFEKDVAVKGQATFNKDTAGYVTIKQGEATAKVTFTTAKARKPVIALTLGEGKFAQYSYRNVTEEGFEIILLTPATEDLSFSWVAIQTDEVAEAPTP